jgi:NADH-quinone oxidoreductase subunit C/D
MLHAQVSETKGAADELLDRFGADLLVAQPTPDDTPTYWVGRDHLPEVLEHLRGAFPMLLDLFGIDERLREHRPSPATDFTVVYHLLNPERCEEFRLKVATGDGEPPIPSAAGIWPNANWYEREAWDMFGIEFSGHPNLRRILLPPTWEGHALRKDHPSRATEMEPFSAPPRTQSSCSSTSAPTTRLSTASSASPCNWTVK